MQENKKNLRDLYDKGSLAGQPIVKPFMDGTISFRYFSAQGETWLKLPLDFFNVSFLLTFSNYIALHFPQYSTGLVTVLPVGFVVWVVSVFFLGKIIDKRYKPVQTQQKIGTDRSPEIQKISKGVQRLLKGADIPKNVKLLKNG